MTHRRTRRRPGEAGFALAVALYAMTTLLLLVASALLVGMANIGSTRNFRGALQVHFAGGRPGDAIGTVRRWVSRLIERVVKAVSTHRRAGWVEVQGDP